MVPNQEAFNLSRYMDTYDIVVPKDTMLRQINDLVNFSFVLEELKSQYCPSNGRDAVSPIRMFKYLLLKSLKVGLIMESYLEMQVPEGQRIKITDGIGTDTSVTPHSGFTSEVK